MNEEHRRMALSFSRVTFLPASFDKRFASAMMDAARSGAPLTEKQTVLLEKMYHRYRKQIPGHEELCVVCAAAAQKGPP